MSRTQNRRCRPARFPAAPDDYFEPDHTGWTYVNCPETPDRNIVPNWVDTPRVAEDQVREVPWLVQQNRPLEDGMLLEVRLDEGEWLLVTVRRSGDVQFYRPLPYVDDELIIDIPFSAELRLSRSAA